MYSEFKKPHIYKRQIVVTGKYYIGKSNGNNKNYKGSGKEYLEDYKLYVKNKKKDLIEEILEYVEDITKLNEREEYWLNLVDAANNPLYYNRTNKRGGPTNHSNKTIDILKQRNIKFLQKETIQYSKEGDFIKEWSSRKEATYYYKLGKGQISQGCSGKCKLVGGFQWRNKTEDYPLKIEPVSYKSKGVIKHTIFTINKMKNSALGKTKSKETIIKMVNSKIGKKQSLETIEKRINTSKERGIISRSLKPIIAYYKDGIFYKEWEGVSIFEKEMNIKSGSGIIQCCRDRQKTAYGFQWRYKTENYPLKIDPVTSKKDKGIPKIK